MPTTIFVRRSGSYLLCGLFLTASLLAMLALQRLPTSAGALEVDMTARVAGVAQLFFDRGNGLSEYDSVKLPIRPGHNALVFELPAGQFSLLRLDPDIRDAQVTVTGLRLRSAADPAATQLPLDHLVPGPGIAALTPTPDGLDVTPTAGTTDPQLLLAADPAIRLAQSPQALAIRLVLALTLLMLAAGTVAALWSGRIDRHALIVIGLLVALALAATMAATSTTTRSVHPDEFSHLIVYQYFRDHWLPPALTDPEVIPRLSGYGYSYLLELDVVYVIAARLTSPLLLLFPSDLGMARLFNLLLLAALLVAALLRRHWAVCLAAVLLTPQTWYVFSYFNGDAMPLALGLICAALISDRNSGLNAYLERRGRLGWSVWLFAVALGLLLVSKRNFLPLLPGFALWLAVCHLRIGWAAVLAILGGLILAASAIFLKAVPALAAANVPAMAMVGGAVLLLSAASTLLVRCWRDRSLRPVMLRLMAVFALVFAVATPRVLYDWWVNGGPAQRSAQVERMIERHAHHDFKPSTQAPGKGYAGRALVMKDVSLREVLFEPYHWLALSGISAFGVYGYFSIFAADWTYVLLGLTTIGMILLASYALMRTRPRDAGRLLLVTAGTALLVALISLLHSWTFDLQPQGRYLLPIIPLIGMALGAGGERLPERPFKLLLIVAIVVSAFSFAGFGLPALMATH